MINRPTQSEIAKALGLSQAAIVKYKRRGMPTDAIDKAAAWHRANIKVTAHRIPRTLAPTVPAGTAAACAAGLLDLAANALGSGHDISAMIPGLREALRAVPSADRAGMLVPMDVFDVLTADVHAALLASDPGGLPGGLSDADAVEMGDFWFRCAAGEVRPA